MEKPGFLHVDKYSWKLSVNWKIVGVRALKLGVSQEGINGIKWFWCVDTNSGNSSYFNNFWVVAVKNGCGLLGQGALKSAASQEWSDEMSWFFCILIQIQES